MKVELRGAEEGCRATYLIDYPPFQLSLTLQALLVRASLLLVFPSDV